MRYISTDFFQEGYQDALREVRTLQHGGQWTKQRRASWIKQAVAYREHLQHTHTSLPQVRAYYAGRIAALKSRRMANFREHDNASVQQRDTIVYHPLASHETRFCGFFDCGSDAIWGVSIFGDGQIFLALCDPCRQEWVRAETVYTTADGWDWDGDEESYGVATLAESYPPLVGWRPWKQTDYTLEVICVLLALLLSATLNSMLGLLVAQLLLAALITRFVLDERKDPPMSIPDYPYEHLLFYDDDVQAEQALAYVTKTFDTAATLSPPGLNDMAHIVCFTTDEEFSDEDAGELIQTLEPSEYDLNYYPWSEEVEDDNE